MQDAGCEYVWLVLVRFAIPTRKGGFQPSTYRSDTTSNGSTQCASVAREEIAKQHDSERDFDFDFEGERERGQ
jgi:hypothetical protein